MSKVTWQLLTTCQGFALDQFARPAAMTKTICSCQFWSIQMTKEWVKIMIRLEPVDAQKMSDAAHAARLPNAVFARELLLSRMPAVAPLEISDLSFEAQELLRVCYASVSNLTQLKDHCTRLGEPFSRLVESIEKMCSATRTLGLNVKSGVVTDAKATELFNIISDPSESLNNLARDLNSGESTSKQRWFEVLTELKMVLLPETLEEQAIKP
jgi:hypothetical protein